LKTKKQANGIFNLWKKETTDTEKLTSAE